MIELHESSNDVEVIGKIKKIELEEKLSKTGRAMIIGYVDVEVEKDDKVNNIRCKVFSFKLKKDGHMNGLYKGYKTVADEYQVGDLVRVTGQITSNEYYKQGTLVQFNEVKAVFFNRLEEEANHKALATLDMVIEGMVSEIDENGVPTGYMEVDAFSIGYNGTVIPLHNLKIGPELAPQFQGMYIPGSTGKITFSINNYAQLEKQEVETQAQPGFGTQERVEADIITNYVNNYEIIGGDLPYTDGVNNYTPQEIEQAHKNRELALQQLKDEAVNIPSEPATGFGSNGSLSEERKQEIDQAVDMLEQKFTGNDVPDF